MPGSPWSRSVRLSPARTAPIMPSKRVHSLPRPRKDGAPPRSGGWLSTAPGIVGDPKAECQGEDYTSFTLRGRSLDQLLASVDVVGAARQRGVHHQVNGQEGDVLRSHDAADRQRLAEPCAPCVELLAEDRGGQRSVHEARGDEVDARRG